MIETEVSETNEDKKDENSTKTGNDSSTWIPGTWGQSNQAYFYL